MDYVVAGYSIVLGILFLYGLQLLSRRRRLIRAAERIGSSAAGESSVPRGDPSLSRPDPMAARR